MYVVRKSSIFTAVNCELGLPTGVFLQSFFSYSFNCVSYLLSVHFVERLTSFHILCRFIRRTYSINSFTCFEEFATSKSGSCHTWKGWHVLLYYWSRRYSKTPQVWYQVTVLVCSQVVLYLLIKYIVSAVVKCYKSSFYRTVDVTSQIQKALTLVASHLLTRHRDLNKNYHLQRCLTLTVHTTSRTSGEGGENSLIQGSFWKLILTIYRYCYWLSCFPFQSFIIGSSMIIV